MSWLIRYPASATVVWLTEILLKTVSSQLIQIANKHRLAGVVSYKDFDRAAYYQINYWWTSKCNNWSEKCFTRTFPFKLYFHQLRGILLFWYISQEVRITVRSLTRQVLWPVIRTMPIKSNYIYSLFLGALVKDCRTISNILGHKIHICLVNLICDHTLL